MSKKFFIREANVWQRLTMIGFFFLVLLGPISFACSNIGMGLIIGGWIAKRVLCSGEETPRTQLDRWLFLFLCFVVLSIFQSNYIDKSLQGIRRAGVYFLLFYAIVGSLRQEKDIRRVFQWLVAGALLVSIDGVLQRFFGKDPLRQFPTVIGYFPDAFGTRVPRLTATFGNPNGFGIYLAVVVPIVAAFAFYGVSFIRRKWSVVAVGLLVVCLILTYSRAAALAVGMSFILFLLTNRKPAIFLLIGLAIAAAALLIDPATLEWARNQPSLTSLLIDKSRAQHMQTAINMIQDNPFLGVGINTFASNYAAFKGAGDPFVTYYGHNAYLHTGAELGLVGLCLLLMILAVTFRTALNAYKKGGSPDRKVMILALSGSFLAFLIVALFESSMQQPKYSLYFWELIALIFVVSQGQTANRENC